MINLQEISTAKKRTRTKLSIATLEERRKGKFQMDGANGKDLKGDKTKEI